MAAVVSVHFDADAYMVCLTHVLSTEREEVMGLLIGEIDERRISHISAVIVLRRSDKRKDRVEISPEQLSAASEKAESLARELGRPMRVLGWYHSHPHITVWPSHVDVRTQACYQLMDEGFIGIIFSCFNDDKNTKSDKIQMTCFQSVNQSPEGEAPQFMKDDVPVFVVPTRCVSKPCLSSLVQLPKILSIEEQEAYCKVTQLPNMDMMSKIYNGSVYTRSLCQIMDVMSGPVMRSLEDKLVQNSEQISYLNGRKQDLLHELSQCGVQWPLTKDAS